MILRALLWVLALALGVSAASAHPSHSAKTHDGISLPGAEQTPGKVAIPDKDTICATKWGLEARHVTPAMKDQVYKDYGAKKRNKDLGGADDHANLWPQPWKQARMKDEVEVWLKPGRVS